MEDNHRLLQPLLIPSTTTTSAALAPQVDEHDEDNQLNHISSIIIRVLLVALIGVISIWASHLSIGYSIAIENESLDTGLGQRFHTFYVSDDEATRIIVKASNEVRDFLYPQNTSYYHVEKKVNRVVLKLIKGQNPVDEIVTVDSGADHSFVIRISPSLMEGADFKQRVLGAVRRGVARVWLYDGRGKAPENVTNGLVGYIAGHVIGSVAVKSAGLVESETFCWRRDDVEGSLDHFESRRPGFVRRLNCEMMDGWDEGMLDRVLGEPLKNLCAGKGSLRYNSSSV